MGNYLTTKSKGTILNNFCQASNRNKDSFWPVMKRISLDHELGVGKIYLEGKSKLKEYENLQCLYDVILYDSLSVIKQKCKSDLSRTINLILILKYKFIKLILSF